MKRIIGAFAFSLVLAFPVLCSAVYGRAYQSSGSPISRAYVVIYDTYGHAVASTVTNSFGSYYADAPCCEYFVITITHRLYSFQEPNRIFNTGLDNGYGFNFDFVTADSFRKCQ